MDELESIGIKAKEASRWIGSLGTNEKNAILKHVAMQIKDNAEYIISENNSITGFKAKAECISSHIRS